MSDPTSQAFLEHVVRAPSQYDATCREMAQEILALRAALDNAPWKASYKAATERAQHAEQQLAGVRAALRAIVEEMEKFAGDACTVYDGDGWGRCETCSRYVDQHIARKWRDRLARLGARAPGEDT